MRLCVRTDTELVIVAPYITFGPLTRVVEGLSPGVVLTVVTRWRLEELAAGVSDLRIWDVVSAHPSGRLLLHAGLHAKYYRSDGECLIGSANLTGKALGWHPVPNLELLFPLPSSLFAAFELHLLAEASPVDKSLVDAMHVALTVFTQSMNLTSRDSHQQVDPEDADLGLIDGTWTPGLRTPAQLCLAYSGRWEALTTTGRIAAQQDLNVLDPPPGLPNGAFDAVIGARLIQLPVINSLDRFLSEPRRFGEVREHLRRSLGAGPDEDMSRIWQTLMRWLMYFLPERYNYERPHHTELIWRRVSS